MARPPATSPLALVLATTAVLSTGCYDTSNTITTADYPTVLTVDPTLFRGTVRCGAPGLVSYVVTLVDVTRADIVTPTKTTVPVPCQSTVSFGEPPIISSPPHYYTAAIDGYDRDVKPAAPDSRDMVDKSTDEPVAPKWLTNCGVVPPPAPAPDAEADVSNAPPYNPLLFPTLALGKTEVIIHGCLPLEPAPVPDASAGDGAIDDGGTVEDAAPPDDASAETSDAAGPDGGGPGEDGGSDDDGEAEGGGEGDGGDGG
jgi:hypothetical protein